MKNIKLVCLCGVCFFSTCVYGQDSNTLDVMPKVKGQKSLEQLEREFEQQAPESIFGVVDVEYLILPAGYVGNSRVTGCYPSENKEALTFEARRFAFCLPSFTPGMKDGQKVEKWLRSRLLFGNAPESWRTAMPIDTFDIISDQTAIGAFDGGEPEELKKVEIQPKEDQDKIYDVVEEMPSFPGGPMKLMEYLSNTLSYPEACYRNNIQGRVIIEFIVESDGSITNAIIKNSVHPLLDAEALRVVKAMPRWNPAIQNGKPVRVKFCVPINFHL